MKNKERERKKAEQKDKMGDSTKSPPLTTDIDVKKLGEESDGDHDMAVSDDDDEKPKLESATPITPLDHSSISGEGLKRKRGPHEGIKMEDEEFTPNKRLKSETPPPPPPPPPPPAAPADGVYPSPENASEATMVDEADDAVGAESNGRRMADTMDDGTSREDFPMCEMAPTPPPPPSRSPMEPTKTCEGVVGRAHTPRLREAGDGTPLDGEDGPVDEHKNQLGREGHGQPHAVQA